MAAVGDLTGASVSASSNEVIRQVDQNHQANPTSSSGELGSGDRALGNQQPTSTAALPAISPPAPSASDQPALEDPDAEESNDMDGAIAQLNRNALRRSPTISTRSTTAGHPASGIMATLGSSFTGALAEITNRVEPNAAAPAKKRGRPKGSKSSKSSRCNAK